jgi:ABC-type transporter Mla MlaB component
MAAREPSILFTINGPIARPDLPGLYGRVCRLLERNRASVVYCDVEGVCADAVTVDALARLQLAARRHHCEIRVRGASKELRELIAFVGVGDILVE